MPAEVVGRERERGVAAAFVSGMAQGPSVLVFEGDAGVGKTTLWLDAIRQAEGRGYRILVARPVEAERNLSYSALADLVGDALEETAAHLPPPQQHAMAVVLLRESASDEPVRARTTAVALLGVLSALAAEQPVLVAVDDVQWLDAASERALAYAARRLPPNAGLLLTRRGSLGDLPLDLERAAPNGRVGQLVVGPLSLAALHHVLRSRLGKSFPRPLLTRITDASGGNPFLALEIGRAAIEQGADRALGDPLPVPRAVKQLSEARIQSLSRAARELLLVTSALFRPTLPTVRAAIGSAAGIDVEAALAEAEDADVLVLERGRLRFTHPVFASAVYASASAGRRRLLHRRLATITDDLEERARHLAHAATDADEALASQIALGAAEAARRGAQEAAAELFEAAHRLTPAEDTDQRARRALGQASALNAIGDFAEARRLAEGALAAAASGPMVVAALSFLGNLAWFAGEASEARRHLEQALVAAGDDAALKGAVYARLARYSITLDPARALRYADLAAPLLRDDDMPLLAHVLLDRFFASGHIGEPAASEALEHALALEARCGAAHEAPHPYPLIWFVANDALAAARARQAYEDDWYRQRGEEIWRLDRRSHLAVAEFRAGDCVGAEAVLEETCAALEHVEVRGPFAMAFEKRALVDAFRGRVDRARSSLVPLIDGFERTGQRWWTALSLSTLGFAELAAGDPEAADRAWVRMGELTRALGVFDVLTDRSEPFHVEVLLELGEVERAREVLRRLEARARWLPRPWTTTVLPRTRALLAAADGDLVGALVLADQLDTVRASRLPFDLGCHLLVKGRLLRRTRQKRAASDALGHAHQIFEQLGAPAWSARAQAELRRVGLRPAAPSELTESERRVAELVATGLTNREVAERLFLSPKTVEANLGRVYAKLGVRSRAELGAMASNFIRPTAQM